MPELEYSNDGSIMSYQHIGQHGGADYAHVIKATRPSTEKEIKPLLVELWTLGYKVTGIKRKPRTRHPTNS